MNPDARGELNTLKNWTYSDVDNSRYHGRTLGSIMGEFINAVRK